MPYLIDANIAIHARDGTDLVLDKLAGNINNVLLSALSLAELERGVCKDSKFTAIRRARLKVLLRALPVIPFDAAAAVPYGQMSVLYRRVFYGFRVRRCAAPRNDAI